MAESNTLAAAIRPVHDFLHCRTPDAWTAHALDNIDSLLQDHASLELKAAQQAQKLIRNFGATSRRSERAVDAGFSGELLQRMSRLAREELRHFEQVVTLIERRGGRFSAVSDTPIGLTRVSGAFMPHWQGQKHGTSKPICGWRDASPATMSPRERDSSFARTPVWCSRVIRS
jgi:hypothetical protein